MSKIVNKALAAGHAYFKVLAGSYITREGSERKINAPGAIVALATAEAERFVRAGVLAAVSAAAKAAHDEVTGAAAKPAAEPAPALAPAPADAAAKPAG